MPKDKEYPVTNRSGFASYDEPSELEVAIDKAGVGSGGDKGKRSTPDLTKTNENDSTSDGRGGSGEETDY